MDEKHLTILQKCFTLEVRLMTAMFWTHFSHIHICESVTTTQSEHTYSRIGASVVVAVTGLSEQVLEKEE